MAWQKVTGYGRRSLAENGIGRYKALIGPRLRARTLPAQQGKVAFVEVAQPHDPDRQAGLGPVGLKRGARGPPSPHQPPCTNAICSAKPGRPWGCATS